MRTQKIVMIDLDADAQRRKYEPMVDYYPRLSELLSDKIKEEQLNLGDEWYLLSVVPAGSSFVPGIYLSTWEYDDSDEPVALDSTDEAEGAMPFGMRPIMDEIFGRRPCGCTEREDKDADVAEDGDTSPHVQFGEKIRVNGVGFVLTSFEQGPAGATVQFLSEAALGEDFEIDFQGPRLHHNQQSYGVEMPVRQSWGREGARVTYAPRGYRGR